MELKQKIMGIKKKSYTLEAGLVLKPLSRFNFKPPPVLGIRDILGLNRLPVSSLGHPGADYLS